MQSQVGGVCPAILETGKKIVTGGGNPFDIYPLGNGLHFDSANRRLFRKEKAEFITRQASTLLLAFFESGKLQLIHIGDLRCVVAGWWWYFRTGIYCCQKAACLLVEMCAGAVILNGDYHYRLKIPVSSEENEKIHNLTRSDII